MSRLVRVEGCKVCAVHAAPCVADDGCGVWPSSACMHRQHWAGLYRYIAIAMMFAYDFGDFAQPSAQCMGGTALSGRSVTSLAQCPDPLRHAVTSPWPRAQQFVRIGCIILYTQYGPRTTAPSMLTALMHLGGAFGVSQGIFSMHRSSLRRDTSCCCAYSLSGSSAPPNAPGPRLRHGQRIMHSLPLPAHPNFAFLTSGIPRSAQPMINDRYFWFLRRRHAVVLARGRHHAPP